MSNIRVISCYSIPVNCISNKYYCSGKMAQLLMVGNPDNGHFSSIILARRHLKCRQYSDEFKTEAEKLAERGDVTVRQ